MSIKTMRVNLDVYKKYTQVHEYSQYDKDVPLEATILKNGLHEDLTGITSRVNIKKPDGTFCELDSTIEGNVVKATLSEQVFTSYGIVKMSIELTKGNERVSLFEILVRVHPATIQDGDIESSNEMRLLDEMLERIGDVDEHESQRKADEVVRQSNETARVESFADIEQRAEACLPIVEASADMIRNGNIDYFGNEHKNIKDAHDHDIDHILGEFNSLHYEGQNFTATNTIARQPKSAILSGNTLVNASVVKQYKNSKYSIKLANEYFLKPNTKYLFKCIHTGTGTQINLSYIRVDDSTYGDFAIVSRDSIHDKAPIYKIFTTGDDIKNIRCYRVDSSDFDLDNIQIFEYQEGMENWDIPYFTGMTSVKSPVLTTTGKNLWNPQTMFKYENLIDGLYSDQLLDFLTIGKEYMIKAYSKTDNVQKVWINFQGDNVDGHNLIASGNVTMGRAFIYNGTQHLGIYSEGISKEDMCAILHDEYDFVIYEKVNGVYPTSYESYKTNILTTLEPVELLSKDSTLNAITGEVYEPMNKKIIDNTSFNWNVLSSSSTETTTTFIANGNDGVAYSKKFMCDKLPNKNSWSDGVRGIVVDNSVIITLNKTELETDDDSGLLKWLELNNLEVVYEKESPSFKTVMLDGDVVAYEGVTHYMCSGETIAPTLSIDVPTDLVATVSDQRGTIEQQAMELQEQEEAQNVLIESQLSMYEAIMPTTLEENVERELPKHIQDLYNLAYERGIRNKAECLI